SVANSDAGQQLLRERNVKRHIGGVLVASTAGKSTWRGSLTPPFWVNASRVLSARVWWGWGFTQAPTHSLHKIQLLAILRPNAKPDWVQWVCTKVIVRAPLRSRPSCSCREPFGVVSVSAHGTATLCVRISYNHDDPLQEARRNHNTKKWYWCCLPPGSERCASKGAQNCHSSEAPDLVAGRGSRCDRLNGVTCYRSRP